MNSRLYIRKLIREQLEKINADYSGKYENLYDFINDNNLQNNFVEKYKKYDSNLTIETWEDFISGEMGTDEEVIGSLTGRDYKVYYDEDNDEFIITKKKTNKLNYKIILSNSNKIIDILEKTGIHSEYKPRFAVVTSNNKIIGGSTYEIDEYNVYNFDIGILEKYQGYGISKKLIDTLTLDAKKLNAYEIKAQVVNNVLFDYLIKNGFKGSKDSDVKYVHKKIKNT